jgi:hypothetical protein
MFFFKRIFLPALFLILLINGGCDKGIEPRPTDEIPGFSGRITFIGAWPDSIQRTHIVVFDSLLEQANDFNVFNLKFVSGEIPYGVPYYDFDSRDSAYVPIVPGTFSYIAVIQQQKKDLSFNRNDWTVAGIYYINGDTTHPAQLTIPEKTLVKNVNIWCDFNNPPPQPPLVR